MLFGSLVWTLMRWTRCDSAPCVPIPLICAPQQEYGSSALMWGGSIGDNDMICALLDAKADMELGNSSGRTALMGAAMCGHIPAVYMLLEARVSTSG